MRRENCERLDAGLGEAVASPLPPSSRAASEQTGLDKPHETVGEDVRGNALDRCSEQRSEVATIDEDDVAQYEQRPAVSWTSTAALIGPPGRVTTATAPPRPAFRGNYRGCRLQALRARR